MAKLMNHDRGEWGVVIREPCQAQCEGTLVGIPAELIDIVVAFCEPVPQNGRQTYGGDYRFENRLYRHGTQRTITGPKMIGLAQTNRQLRYFWLRHMFKDRVLVLLHEDVGVTASFLASLYPSARNRIRGLKIEWQRTKPIDLTSFRRLCGIFNGMRSLKILHLTLPVNGEFPFRARLDPGLWNALVWHKDKIFWDLKHAFEALRGFGFSTSWQAAWVRDLLRVKSADGNELREFVLHTYPHAEGLRVWVENKMTLEWEYKITEVERITRQRGVIDWFFR